MLYVSRLECYALVNDEWNEEVNLTEGVYKRSDEPPSAKY